MTTGRDERYNHANMPWEYISPPTDRELRLLDRPHRLLLNLVNTANNILDSSRQVLGQDCLAPPYWNVVRYRQRDASSNRGRVNIYPPL